MTETRSKFVPSPVAEVSVSTDAHPGCLVYVLRPQHPWFLCCPARVEMLAVCDARTGRLLWRKWLLDEKEAAAELPPAEDLARCFAMLNVLSRQAVLAARDVLRCIADTAFYLPAEHDGAKLRVSRQGEDLDLASMRPTRWLQVQAVQPGDVTYEDLFRFMHRPEDVAPEELCGIRLYEHPDSVVLDVEYRPAPEDGLGPMFVYSYGR